jgi:hypothetical protein
VRTIYEESVQTEPDPRKRRPRKALKMNLRSGTANWPHPCKQALTILHGSSGVSGRMGGTGSAALRLGARPHFYPLTEIRDKIDWRDFRGELLYCYIKAIRAEECGGVQEDFERTFAIRKEPEGLLLARARHPEPGYWYLIWLSPEKDTRALYREFKPIGADALPGQAELLSGHAGTFKSLFACE